MDKRFKFIREYHPADIKYFFLHPSGYEKTVLAGLDLKYIEKLTSKKILGPVEWGGKFSLSGEELDIEDKFTAEYRHNSGRPAPNQVFRSVVKIKRNDKVLYDVKYSIDSYTRRVVRQKQVTAENFFLLLGGSFAFGEGLADRETFQYRIEKKLPNFQMYNFASHGFGPNDLLSLLRKKRALQNKGVSQKKGVSLYLYMDHHADRLFGTPGVVNRWGSTKPFFEIKNRNLIEQGTFADSRWLVNFVYYLLEQSEVANYFKIRLPIYGAYHKRLFGRVFAEIKSEVNKQFGEAKLVVVYAPFFSHQAERWTETLRQNGIDVLDYSRLDLDRILKGNVIIQNEGHPSKEYMQLLSLLVERDLRQLVPEKF